MAKKYKIEFSRRARDEFFSLPKNLAGRIADKLAFFETQPNPLLYAKKLAVREDTFRFRIGNYRVIFSLKERDIIVILLILKVGHRRDVYEK